MQTGVLQPLEVGGPALLSTGADHARREELRDFAKVLADGAARAESALAEEHDDKSRNNEDDRVPPAHQPLTIHTLNDQLLRADPRSSVRGPAAQTNAAQPAADPSRENGASTGESGVTPLRTSGPQGMKEAPHESESEPAQSGRKPIESGREPHAGAAERDATTRQQPPRDRRGDEAKVGAGTPNPTVSPASFAPAALPASGKREADAVVRQGPAPAQPTGAIAATSGRNAGSEAQLPRWGQKAVSSDQKRASAERTASMVAGQASRGLVMAMSRADGAVTLRLNPESLGFVRIRLEMANGGIVARFEASTEQARQLLEQSSETLRASLEAKGWEASQVRVELLREADPAAEMLKRLERQAELGADRLSAQDAPSQSQWNEPGDSGGGRDRLFGGSGLFARAEEADAVGAIPTARDDQSVEWVSVGGGSQKLDTIA